MTSRSEHSKAKTALPERLRELFWEYPFDELTWEEDRDLVIGRVLSRGPWETVEWLRREVGDEAVRGWIERARGRGLSRRQLRFWQLVLELPPEEVDAWLEEPEPDLWEHRVG